MRRRKGLKIDEIDKKILEHLQEDCRVSLEELSSKLNLPKSTLHYRIKRLERMGIIEGYYAKVDPAKLGKDYITITLVRAKYGPGYHKRVGEKLANLPGVWGVYFVLGETDFVVLAKTRSREEFMGILEKMINDEDIERTSTLAVVEVIKEDPRVRLD